MTENVNEQDIDLLDFDSEPQRKTYCSYMSYQNFSSDEPTYQINNSHMMLATKDRIEASVLEIFKSVTTYEGMTDTSTRWDFDSFSAIEFSEALSALFDIKLPLTLAFDFTSCVDVASHIFDCVNI